MRTVLFASLRTYARRYAAAVVAVVAAVALIVVTNALTSATKAGLFAGIDAPLQNAVGAVDLPTREVTAKYVEQGGWPMALSMQPVRSETKMFGQDIMVGTVSTEKRWQWQDLEEGRFPTRAGESVVDANAAKTNKVAVGDRLQVGSGDTAVDTTVVGLVDAPSMWSSSIYVTWPEIQSWEEQYVQAVLTADTGDKADGWLSTDDYLTELQTQLNKEVNIIAYMVLIFAFIALFVSVLVITNTFSILFAQRMRDFALLRAMGATKRQVLRSVRREALVLGLLASLLGLAVGALLGWGIVALVRQFAETAPLGAVSFEWPWLAAAFVLGVLTTLVASWLPTRRLMRLSPLAALRPQDGFDVRGAGKFRIGFGLLVVLAGVATIFVAVGWGDPQAGMVIVLFGCAVTFLGVMILGPVLVPGLVRLAGAALGTIAGSPAKLAAANAGRNPKRTAATAASLLVGVTLTTGVLTGMSTIRTATVDEMAAQHPIDLALQAESKPLEASVLEDAKSVPGVADAVAVPGTMASVEDDGKPVPVPVVAPPAGDIALRDLSVKPGTMVLSPLAASAFLENSFEATGEKVTLVVGDRSATVTLDVREIDGAAQISAATLEELTDAPKTYAVWVRAEAGADPEDMAGSLGALAPDAELINGKAQRAWVELQLDVFTWSVIGLLAISVLIALAGIANTLGLSVLERGREHALLRALGLTKRQLRRTLAAEAVLLSAVAALVGTALGVFFAWGGSEILVGDIMPDATFQLPVLQLIGVVVAAGLAGLISCVAPSKRATKVSPAEGLALD
ncbi:FtsX-like permease family protein [Nocardioides sp.]|uniref:ABC transporter permease n=1 Tax=Nocardioides sp. TaxID=35761 RepID=UPI00198F3394|nr:FtsX-like permease family protein [Nocardioides sp.]MBC7278587.1 FtsX-like permease family protein [Nocardioides sp.]